MDTTRLGPKATGRDARRSPAIAALTVFIPLSLVATACAGSVPSSDVTLEATQIKKNVAVAQALHARCVDAGPDAAAAVTEALCADEMRALGDINTNADTLLQKAGAADAGKGATP